MVPPPEVAESGARRQDDAHRHPGHRHDRQTQVMPPGQGGDLPTAADLGQTVYFDDDQTVKHTQATHDVGGTLVEIEGSLYWVEA